MTDYGFLGAASSTVEHNASELGGLRRAMPLLATAAAGLAALAWAVPGSTYTMDKTLDRTGDIADAGYTQVAAFEQPKLPNGVVICGAFNPQYTQG